MTRTQHGFFFDAASLASVSGEDLAIAFGVDDSDLFDDSADDVADLVALTEAIARYRDDVDCDGVFSSSTSTDTVRFMRAVMVAE